MKELIVRCGCGSNDHLLFLNYDPGDQELYLVMHLTTWRQWWRRAGEAIKYVFSNHRLGWDEIVVGGDTARKMITFLDDYLADTLEVEWPGHPGPY